MAQAVLDAKQYEADLQKLLQILTDESSDEFTSLCDIGGLLRLRMETDHEEERADVPDIRDAGCVQGMTVHSSKGLEFDRVVMPFMYDQFDKKDRSEILIDKEARNVGWRYHGKNGEDAQNSLYAALKVREDREVIGDETRLLYVAMTRPIRGLYCFTWWKRSRGEPQTWSDLLPEEKDDANYL